MSYDINAKRQEGPSASRPCGDCGVEPGQPHVPGCDVAVCLHTGGQAIQCPSGAWWEYGDEDGEGPPDDLHEDCGQDVWTGEFPGAADARRLGFWSYWEDGKGWVRCDASHPKAGPDLNRLHGLGGEVRWDRETKRWEARA